MTNEQLLAHEERLNAIHMSLVTDLVKMAELVKALKEYIKSNNEYLEAVEVRMDKHMDATKLFLELVQAVLKAFTDINGTLAENNQRTTQLITKVESYFGSGAGLEHEN